MKRFVYTALILLSALLLFSCIRENKVPSKTETGHTETDALTESTAVGTFEEETTEKETAPDLTTMPPLTTEPPISASSVTVTYPVSFAGYTYTGLASLAPVEYTVNDPGNSRGLSDLRNPFSFGVASGGTPHSITVNNQQTFDSFGTNALAWDNKTEKKVLYLTFDCGYKYEDLTARILNTLKEKNVKAAFFCTMDYLRSEPSEIARMIDEGHTVGNHSVTHPDCTTVSRERLAWELLGVHNYMRVNFGYSPKYFRFPTGAFSEDSLELVNSLGYRSVFWSVAYADWDPKAQQGAESAYSQVISRLHPGAVILLHSTSPDNAEILGRVIDHALAEGYEFCTLDQYDHWK